MSYLGIDIIIFIEFFYVIYLHLSVDEAHGTCFPLRVTATARGFRYTSLLQKPATTGVYLRRRRAPSPGIINIQPQAPCSTRNYRLFTQNLTQNICWKIYPDVHNNNRANFSFLQSRIKMFVADIWSLLHFLKSNYI